MVCPICLKKVNFAKVTDQRERRPQDREPFFQKAYADALRVTTLNHMLIRADYHASEERNDSYFEV